MKTYYSIKYLKTHIIRIWLRPLDDLLKAQLCRIIGLDAIGVLRVHESHF